MKSLQVSFWSAYEVHERNAKHLETVVVEH